MRMEITNINVSFKSIVVHWKLFVSTPCTSRVAWRCISHSKLYQNETKETKIGILSLIFMWCVILGQGTWFFSPSRNSGFTIKCTTAEEIWAFGREQNIHFDTLNTANVQKIHLCRWNWIKLNAKTTNDQWNKINMSMSSTFRLTKIKYWHFQYICGNVTPY